MASQAEQYHHPLPSPPQQAEAPQPPPHHRQQSHASNVSQSKPRTFSFHSDKSHRSSNSKPHLVETHEEKESRRLHSKADPTLAMNEAEPSAVAAMMTQSTHVPLRSIQHKDMYGNTIADPDKSNPTRNRWERPLDTIRSFEAAIDGGYNRKSMMRPESGSQWNRRASYHQGGQPRFPQDSYYSSRPVSFRPEQTQFGLASPGPSRNSYFGNQGHNGYDNGYGQQHPRQRPMRTHTEPHYQLYGREQNVYPMPHKDRSYETVTSAAGSGSEHAGYQTDPTSSDNSSIERNSPAKRQEPVNDYGIGFSQSQSYQAPNFSVGSGGDAAHPLPQPPPQNYQPQQGQQYQQPPASNVPRKQPTLLRRQSSQAQSEAPEKRKSWFARRFSKN